MAWVRFEDITSDHPKFADLGSYAPLCGWLWFSASCYCMRHLTDGAIGIETLRALWPYRHIGIGKGDVMGSNGDLTADDLVPLLIHAKLLDQIDETTYRVHDFLDYKRKQKSQKK